MIVGMLAKQDGSSLVSSDEDDAPRADRNMVSSCPDAPGDTLHRNMRRRKRAWK